MLPILFLFEGIILTLAIGDFISVRIWVWSLGDFNNPFPSVVLIIQSKWSYWLLALKLLILPLSLSSWISLSHTNDDDFISSSDSKSSFSFSSTLSLKSSEAYFSSFSIYYFNFVNLREIGTKLACYFFFMNLKWLI